jgi:hypothetical protein
MERDPGAGNGKTRTALQPMVIRGREGRRLLISAAYAAGLAAARKHLDAMAERHERNYAAVLQRAEHLRDEVEHCAPRLRLWLSGL